MENKTYKENGLNGIEGLEPTCPSCGHVNAIMIKEMAMKVILRPIQDSSGWLLPATVINKAAQPTTRLLEEIEAFGMITRYGDSRTFTVVRLASGEVMGLQHFEQSKEFESYFRKARKRFLEPSRPREFGVESIIWNTKEGWTRS